MKPKFYPGIDQWLYHVRNFEVSIHSEDFFKGGISWITKISNQPHRLDAQIIQ